MSSFKNFDHEAANYDNRGVERLIIKRRKPRPFRIIVLLIALIGISYVAGCFGNIGGSLWSKLASSYFGNRINAADNKGTFGQEKWLNILLVGVDQRKNEPSRSDTMMVAMINLKDRYMQVVSIPRDTRVRIEGMEHKGKINSAHAKGGIELTKTTIEGLLGIPIHNYVETNFEGFENIVDLLGGVDFEVEKRMYYPAENINLHKGFQHLDGHHALAYVRFRSDGKGDLPRIQRQHKFLSALADQVLQPQTIIKVPKLMNEMYKYIHTDMSVADLVILAGEFRNLSSDKIHFADIPGKPDYVNGISYYVVNEDKLKIFMDAILSGKNPVTVLEQTTPEGQTDKKDSKNSEGE